MGTTKRGDEPTLDLTRPPTPSTAADGSVSVVELKSEAEARTAMRKLFGDVATIDRPQMYNVKGGTLVDQDVDGTETFLVADDFRQHCPRCDKHRFHDIYAELGGAPIVQCRTYAHCRDCGFESSRGEPKNVGTADALTTAVGEPTPHRAAGDAERRIRRRRAAQRQARRKNRAR